MIKSYREESKASGKRKYILIVLLFLLAVGVVGAVIHFYPVWSSAEIIHREADLSSFYYEIEVELDQAGLPEEQQKLFGMLERLAGCEQDAMYQLRIRGSVWEDRIHVLLYPKGMQEPLIEMYLSDGDDMLSETVLYNVIREHLVEQFDMLGLLMTKQTDDVYITLEQVEQMFGVDLSGIRSFALPEAEELSTWQYFVMLALLRGEKLENGRMFSASEDQFQMELVVAEGEGQCSVRCALSVQDPGTLSEGIDLSRLSGLFPDAEILEWPEQLSMFKSIDIVLTWGEDQEISMPKELVSQDTVELISKIRQLVQKLTGKQNKAAKQ